MNVPAEIAWTTSAAQTAKWIADAPSEARAGLLEAVRVVKGWSVYADVRAALEIA